MNDRNCGCPVGPEHITGATLRSIVPEDAVPGTMQKHSAGVCAKELRKTEGSGGPLDITCAGMAAWVSAEYGLPCKKVICQNDMADLGEEELQ